MIGIRLTGKKISASVFTKSVASLVDLIKDVDRAISRKSGGRIRWDLLTLGKSSPAVVEFAAVSRSKSNDYIAEVQLSILHGLEQLAEGPEQPEHYSYSALENVRTIAEQSAKLTGIAIYSDAGQSSFVDQRVFNNVEYLIASGTVSMGSVRGSLDAITVHDGHEFRIWPSPMTKQAVTCRFKKSILSNVARHLKQEVEVFGKIHRNAGGEPFLVDVHEFSALKAVTFPGIQEMSGLLSDFYAGLSLKDHLDDLRNG
jgi:hypothetical protein